MRADLQQLFVRQHGVVTTEQALRHGESYETIRRRVANNDWARPLPRILTPVGLGLSFAGRLAAASLSIGGDLAFAGSTAAAIWQIPEAEPPDRLHVVVADTRDARSCEFVYVQRRSGLLNHVYRRGDWPVVSVEQALLGCAPDRSFPVLVDAIADLLRLRRTSVPRLAAVTGRGIKGSTALTAALAVAGDGMGSKWERRLARHLVSAGRPKAVPQLRIEAENGLVAYVDLAFPEVKLAVEIDGYVAHSRPAEFRYDRVRQNALITELGWTLLRYTPFEIASAPDRSVAQIWRCYQRLQQMPA